MTTTHTDHDCCAAERALRDDAIRKVFAQVSVNPETNCWLFTGYLRLGYGQISINRDTVDAHRVVYEHSHGPIPDGHVVHHICQRKNCVNPLHLKAMTRKEHMVLHNFRGKSDFCSKGHAMTEENTTTITRGKNGSPAWFCKTCGREKANERASRWTPEEREAHNAKRREQARNRQQAERDSNHA